MTVSAALLQAVKQSGLSLYRIAKDSGVRYAALHGFVNDGRDLQLCNVDRLAAFFRLELRPAERKRPNP